MSRPPSHDLYVPIDHTYCNVCEKIKKDIEFYDKSPYHCKACRRLARNARYAKQIDSKESQCILLYT